jgi:hypothetical protein
MENPDQVGWLQDLSDANWLIASSPALNTQTLTLVPICAVFFFPYFFLPFFSFFFENVYKLFLQTFLCVCNLISTKPAEGMNAYMHKYAYKYNILRFFDYQ